MARPEITGRKLTRPRRPPLLGKTVAQFCIDWGVSRSTWNNWKRLGVGPDVMQPGGPGGVQFITPESEAVWKARRTVQRTAAVVAGEVAAASAT